jgi:hypothetical protein
MEGISYGINSQNVKNNNMSFKGRIGDKFVSDLVQGKVVKTQEVMDAVKGTFGPKSEKVADVVESLMGKVQVLVQQGKQDANEIMSAHSKLRAVPEEMQKAVSEKESEVKGIFTRIIDKKDAEIASKDAEIAKLKKYEGMSKVKSIEELGVIMPDTAIQTAKDMASNKIASRESMFNYLMTGSGQEEAIAQMERNDVINKITVDGTARVPEVAQSITAMREAGVDPEGSSLNFFSRLVRDALCGNPKGSYIQSEPIKNQVRENAIALMKAYEKTPTANSDNYITKSVDSTLDFAQNYHTFVARGKQKLANNPKLRIQDTPVMYDSKNSYVTISDGVREQQISYDDLYISGQSSF